MPKHLRSIRIAKWFLSICATLFFLSALPVKASPTRESAMNLHWVKDWLPPILSDAMQSNRGRAWQAVGTTNSLPAHQLDADGWPMVDAEIAVWHGLSNSRTGRYTIYFEGSATINVMWTTNAVITSNQFNAQTGQSVAILQLNAHSSGLRLGFVNTNGGVRNVQIMRPIAEGSNTSHDPAEVVDRVIKDQLSKLSIIRYMDAHNTNSAPETTWDTRAIPGSRRNFTVFNPFRGESTDNEYGYVGGFTQTSTAFEYIVAIANATQTDAWISVPAMVDDDFTRKLAQLFKYGSDGVMPYTSPQENPVWAPLDPNLKLYVEYSNEVWNTNTGFRQNHYSRWAAVNLVNNDLNHPINFGGLVSTPGTAQDQVWALRARYTAWRAAEISRIFRQVFGEAEIMERVRPLYCWQIRRSSHDGTPELHWAQSYYAETEGLGLSHFFWGGGPANYRSNRGESFNNLDQLWDSGTHRYQTHYDEMVLNANIASSFGLRMISYEGGPSFGDSLGSSGDWHPIALEAFVDPRMYDKVVETLDILEQVGGAFGTLYVWHHGWAWSFLHPETFSDDTFRAQAMYDAKGATRRPPLHGQIIPFTFAGRNHNSHDPAWKNNDSSPTGSHNLGGGERAGYVFRSLTGGNFSAAIRYQSNQQGKFHLLINGERAATITIPASTSSTTTAAFPFQMDPNTVGGLSILNASSDRLTIHEVIIEEQSGPAAPLFSAQPLSLTRTEGQSALFTVSVTGNPTPSLQWQKNGEDIDGATNTSLLLENLVLSDAGNYRVRATNASGTLTSAEAVLTVNPAGTEPNHAPVAAFTSSSLTGPAPLTFTLDASSSSDPDGDSLTYEWNLGSGFSHGSVFLTHTFPNPGSYVVQLRVSDGEFFSTASLTLTVTTSDVPSGGVLAEWDFTGSGSAASGPATSEAAGLNASAAALGAGFLATNYVNGDALTGRERDAATLAQAITEQEYIGFTLTPAAGKTLSLSGLELRPVSQNVARTFTVMSSKAGFGEDNALASLLAQSNNGSEVEVVNLSGLSDLTEPLEIRIYIHGEPGQYGSVGLGASGSPGIRVLGTVADMDTMAEGFNAWRASNFSEAQLSNAAVSGPLAAPHGDGMPNLLKYAMGFRAGDFVPRALHFSMGAEGAFVYSFQRDSTVTGITFEVQHSTDLLSWEAFSSAHGTLQVVDDDGNGIEQVEIRTGPGFLRLIAE